MWENHHLSSRNQHLTLNNSTQKQLPDVGEWPSFEQQGTWSKASTPQEVLMAGAVSLVLQCGNGDFLNLVHILKKKKKSALVKIFQYLKMFWESHKLRTTTLAFFLLWLLVFLNWPACLSAHFLVTTSSRRWLSSWLLPWVYSLALGLPLRLTSFLPGRQALNCRSLLKALFWIVPGQPVFGNEKLSMKGRGILLAFREGN